jgi:hypothetical protein
MAMASSIGKNKANAGNKIVPRPKPENNVSPEAISAVIQTTQYIKDFHLLSSTNVILQAATAALFYNLITMFQYSNYFWFY